MNKDMYHYAHKKDFDKDKFCNEYVYKHVIIDKAFFLGHFLGDVVFQFATLPRPNVGPLRGHGHEGEVDAAFQHCRGGVQRVPDRGIVEEGVLVWNQYKDQGRL